MKIIKFVFLNEQCLLGKTAGNFHLIITNDDLESAYNKLKSFIEENILTTSTSNSV